MASSPFAAQPFFVEERPTDPHKALDLLLTEALPRVPEIAHAQLVDQFEGLRSAWSSRVLLQGEAEIRAKAIPYLENLSRRPSFGHFEVSANPHRTHAELMAVSVDASGRTQSVWPFRAWRCDGRIFGCGNSLLEA